MRFKRKLIFIIPSFRRGGVERVTLNIINSLDTDLYDITFIICVGKNNEMLQFLYSDINVIELNKSTVHSSLWSIYRIIKNTKPNIVFTSFMHLAVPAIVFNMFIKNKYINVVRLNTLPSNNLSTRFLGKLYGLIFSKAINKADWIISQSEEMAKDALKYYKLDVSKIKIIHNLVDVEDIRKLSKDEKVEKIQEKEEYTLLTIGSLGPVKGYHLLIKAFDILINKKNIETLKLFIIGDNRDPRHDYKKELQDLIDKYKVGEYVKLLGFKKNPYPYLVQANAFVSSSLKEGFPNVVLEALVLNKPCLVTNCIDYSFIIDNYKNGVIIEKNNVEALANGILEVSKINSIDSLKIVNYDYNKWFEEISI